MVAKKRLPGVPPIDYSISSQTNRVLKRELFREGVRECQACGWSPPHALWLEYHNALLHLHHIFPLALGGLRTDRGNLILLCPTHHEIADYLAFRSVNAQREYCGPRTRKDLIDRLRRLDRGEIEVLEEAPKAMEGLNADE